MATQASIDVQSSGTNAVATFQQTQGGSTVNVQQAALVDATSSTPAQIDANGAIYVRPYVGTPKNSGPQTASVAGGGGGTATLASGLITVAAIASLQHALFGATTPCSWTLQTVNASGTPASVFTVVTPAFGSFDFKPGMVKEVATVAGDNVHVQFQVVCTNLDTSGLNTASAYAYFNWAEN